MASNPNIFFERDDWKQPLSWSAALHGGFVLFVVAYAVVLGQQKGNNWGESDTGSAMGVTLVSRVSVPLPANPAQNQNVLANQSQGLTLSEPKAVEQAPEAIPIPDRLPKIKADRNSRVKTPPPPPEDNTVPYGEGGPVSGPYTTFSATNAQGGMSFGATGDFGRLYGWYVDVVRRKVSENWMKYEVDPSIALARRVYLTFDILRDGQPSNVQVEQSSGVPSLDLSAVRALQRIDSFGPLPQGYSGNQVSVEFWFDYKK